MEPSLSQSTYIKRLSTQLKPLAYLMGDFSADHDHRSSASSLYAYRFGYQWNGLLCRIDLLQPCYPNHSNHHLARLSTFPDIY